MIKIGNDLDLLQRVKERFDLDREIVLQKYNDSWGEWVDVSCPVTVTEAKTGKV